MYIIVFRNSHRDPFVDVDSRYFLESYQTYEEAKEAAEKIEQLAGDKDPHYFDWKIYEQVNS